MATKSDYRRVTKDEFRRWLEQNKNSTAIFHLLRDDKKILEPNSDISTEDIIRYEIGDEPINNDIIHENDVPPEDIKNDKSENNDKVFVFYWHFSKEENNFKKIFALTFQVSVLKYSCDHYKYAHKEEQHIHDKNCEGEIINLKCSLCRRDYVSSYRYNYPYLDELKCDELLQKMNDIYNIKFQLVGKIPIRSFEYLYGPVKKIESLTRELEFNKQQLMDKLKCDKYDDVLSILKIETEVHAKQVVQKEIDRKRREEEAELKKTELEYKRLQEENIRQMQNAQMQLQNAQRLLDNENLLQQTRQQQLQELQQRLTEQKNKLNL